MDASAWATFVTAANADNVVELRRTGARRVSELRRAIAVRQPYAWAIIHGGKDIENRNQRAALQFKPAIGERVLIHASEDMTAAEYENAAAFMANTASGAPSARRCSSAA